MGEMEGQPTRPHTMQLVAAADSTVEDATSFISRTVSWWDKVILAGMESLPPKSDPYNILAVTHGGFIGTMTRNLIQSRRVKCARGVVVWRCANTSVTLIELDGSSQGTLVKYGDITHMKKENRDVPDTNADEIEVK